jgi:uncharacterized protein YqgC (DUF456 family)
MDTIWWLVAVILMAVGLIGTVLPVIPGTAIILGAAILHRIMVGPERGVPWWSIALLVLLTLASYALELGSSYFGAKRFGASRWGIFGATVGVVIGIFSGFVLLLVAPVIGAIVGELIAGKQLVAAGRAGWGSLLGNLAGMVGKLLIALAMVTIFLLTAKAPFG